MNKEDIDKLIAKYFDGTTSVEEGEVLLKYFQKDAIPHEFTTYRDQFQFIGKSRIFEVSEDFEKRFEEKFGLKEIKQRSFKVYYNVAATIALLLISVVLIYFFEPSFFDKEIGLKDVTTIQNQQKTITLSDGTIVSLNSKSRISFPEEFTEEKREVFLEGEAFFEVVSDKKHPFFIHTSQSVTQVLGTTFNIRGYPGEEKVEVVVVTGKVAFSSHKDELQEKVFLLPNNGATFDRKNNTISKTENIDPNLIAWKTRKLVFNDAPLDEVAKVLTRYFGIDIEILDPELASCHFKGTFREARLEEIFKVMNYSMNIKPNKSNGKYVLSGKGCR